MSLPQPPPQALVIFGASGDLTRRKILPALYNLARERMLPERFFALGYARSDLGDDGFRELARKAVEEHSRAPLEEEVFADLARRLYYVSGEYSVTGCFAPLDARLEELSERHETGPSRLYYLAVPPGAFPHIVSRLAECAPQGTNRIVVEKPFGRDLASAHLLNDTVHAVFGEEQVFRIDHYLGKETVQNIVVFRFANAMFERVWNRDAIDHVQITVAESVGVGDRAGYYEHAGALRDMIQSHVLQLLAFIAMEPPRTLDPEAIRDEKMKVLQAMRPLDPREVVRGQYAAGTVDGVDVRGYRDEDGVEPGSDTETFVAARAWIDNWRWDGIPFYLRTGKRMRRRVSEIVVVFREAPGYLFDSYEDAPSSNHLLIDVQPGEAVTFSFQAKEPGPGFRRRAVHMGFEYEDFFRSGTAEAYERLIHDAMHGDSTLFTREDEVERSWRIVEPVLREHAPVVPYEAGAWGPPEASALLEPRRWHRR